MGKCPIAPVGRGGWVDGGDSWEAGVRVVEGCGFCVAHFFRCTSPRQEVPENLEGKQG